MAATQKETSNLTLEMGRAQCQGGQSMALTLPVCQVAPLYLAPTLTTTNPVSARTRAQGNTDANVTEERDGPHCFYCYLDMFLTILSNEHSYSL